MTITNKKNLLTSHIVDYMLSINNKDLNIDDFQIYYFTPSKQENFEVEFDAIREMRKNAVNREYAKEFIETGKKIDSKIFTLSVIHTSIMN